MNASTMTRPPQSCLPLRSGDELISLFAASVRERRERTMSSTNCGYGRVTSSPPSKKRELLFRVNDWYLVTNTQLDRAKIYISLQAPLRFSLRCCSREPREPRSLFEGRALCGEPTDQSATMVPRHISQSAAKKRSPDNVRSGAREGFSCVR